MIWRGILENRYMGVFSEDVWEDMIWEDDGVLQYNISLM